MSYDSIRSFSRRLFREASIETHPLFGLLAGGDLAPEEARKTALDLYHVVQAFPRFLSALITNIPDHRLRMPLVDNLFEEHGRMNLAHAHVETYKAFLKGLALEDAEIERSRPSIPVIAYTRAILDLCLHHPSAEGIGALAVIEEIVARVSPMVSRYARSRWGGTGKSVQHFGEHEVLDVTHAEEIYRMAGELPEALEGHAVERGMALGMYYHRRLYSDLVEAVRSGAPAEDPAGCLEAPALGTEARGC